MGVIKKLSQKLWNLTYIFNLRIGFEKTIFNLNQDNFGANRGGGVSVFSNILKLNLHQGVLKKEYLGKGYYNWMQRCAFLVQQLEKPKCIFTCLVFEVPFFKENYLLLQLKKEYILRQKSTSLPSSPHWQNPTKIL